MCWALWWWVLFFRTASRVIESEKGCDGLGHVLLLKKYWDTPYIAYVVNGHDVDRRNVAMQGNLCARVVAQWLRTPACNHVGGQTVRTKRLHAVLSGLRFLFPTRERHEAQVDMAHASVGCRTKLSKRRVTNTGAVVPIRLSGSASPN